MRLGDNPQAWLLLALVLIGVALVALALWLRRNRRAMHAHTLQFKCRLLVDQ